MNSLTRFWVDLKQPSHRHKGSTLLLWFIAFFSLYAVDSFLECDSKEQMAKLRDQSKLNKEKIQKAIALRDSLQETLEGPFQSELERFLLIDRLAFLPQGAFLLLFEEKRSSAL